jgi:CheY-like chemotaxis protein
MRRPIVVVEDDEDLGAIIAETLSDAGYEAVIFTSSESALRYFDSAEAAMVLTDLHLGVMDGWAFIERMRQRFGDEPPIVLMTGSVVDAERLRAPARAVLSKPFELTTLVETVARWVAPAQ